MVYSHHGKRHSSALPDEMEEEAEDEEENGYEGEGPSQGHSPGRGQVHRKVDERALDVLVTEIVEGPSQAGLEI